jgi:hypothetical protein
VKWVIWVQERAKKRENREMGGDRVEERKKQRGREETKTNNDGRQKREQKENTILSPSRAASAQ